MLELVCHCFGGVVTKGRTAMSKQNEVACQPDRACEGWIVL